MVQAIIVLVFIVLMMALMVSGKCPTLIALPILTVGIAIVCGLPLTGEESLLQTVIEDGAVRLSTNYAQVIIATWVGCLMAATGITETMIRKAAEFGGDKTLVVTLLLFFVSIGIFAAVPGLGGVIMVGSIVLPILISVGVDKFTAASVLLLSYGAGENFSLTRTSYFAGVVGVEHSDVYFFCCILASVTAIAGLVYILVRYFKNGRKFAFSAKVNAIEEKTGNLKGFSGAMAMLTPFIPILLVVALKWPIIPAFLVALVWAFVWTSKGKSWKEICNLFSKTCYNGFMDAAPCAALMIFIGMLLKVINTTAVNAVLAPLVNSITPTSPLTFILFFAICAPLVLYRGPLNLYGLGAGIAALMTASGIVSPTMVFVGFVGVCALQGSSCPTNTHNV